MKKINVIIIDDEPKCVELLSHILQNYHKDICVLATADSMKTGLALIEKHRPHLHILFLDIQMSGGDGFTLLENIPKINFKVIFTTAYDHFAIRAIKFSALDYLLKPIDNKELSDALEKFRVNKNSDEAEAINNFKTTLQQRKVFEKLAIATLTDIKFINLDKITYLESDNNYSTIYMENKQRLVSSKNIGYYEDLLEINNFFRINNSHLVNLKKIERFLKSKTGSVELEDGKILQVSAGKKEKLIKLLGLV